MEGNTPFLAADTCFPSRSVPLLTTPFVFILFTLWAVVGLAASRGVHPLRGFTQINANCP